ncbi:MAG: transcriptional regulator [Candidatus Sedimenticola sp. (ex Thyasira tokunagai)]
MTALAKAKFEGTIQPWGNSLGIRVTRPMCDMAHLGKGDKIAIEVTETGLMISRKKAVKRLKLPYSEADMLVGMTPHKAHADELPTVLDSEVGS